MKKIRLTSSIADFEATINREDIEVLKVDIKVVEQSYLFQECFAAIIYYEEKNKVSLSNTGDLR